MSKMLLLGDEAVAMGAIDAGLSVAYGYPGTPSTEIMEYLQMVAGKTGEFQAHWCSNEKTAYEEAVGVSFVGRRSIVTMKHVGLNVAADAFINSALVKINGGLVLAVADDPGMHSSQNEQDSRFFSDFAGIMCFEPRDHQEAYDMTREAFDISEKFNIPVMVRLVTRLSHSRGQIETASKREQNPLFKAENKWDWMTLPSCSRKFWDKLLDARKDFQDYAEKSDFNPLEINDDFKDYGVITTGLGGNYYMENLPDLPVKPSRLHLGVYPAPVEKIKKLAKSVGKLIVIEEGYPYIEKQLRSILDDTSMVSGKMDGLLPRTGELNPDNVREALSLPEKPGIGVKVENLPGRPPQLCAGCPHQDTFNALKTALEDCENSIVTSDIGCYALGAMPPYSTVETILCMGASVGMAKGASEAGYENVVATIGDSTFLHSGITPLVDAVSRNTNMTLIIMDNSTTAMTGGQDTILTSTQIETLVKGVGVLPEHVRVMNPLKKHHEENVRMMKEEIAYKGVSVIIPLRECIQTARNSKKRG